MSKPPEPTQPLQPVGSLILDIARFGSAIAVAVGHLTNRPFSTGWPYLLHMATGAVAIFFVLSGFVIRLITTVRPVTLRSYAVDRFSRIFSVLLPALLLTVFVAACLHSLPSRGNVEPVSFAAPILALQASANLTFTSQIWGLDIPVSFNDVFWSFSYEWFYYCMYAAAFFGRGAWRWLLLILLCLIAGPPISFLLPLWLLGCATHDLYQYLRLKAWAFPVLTALGIVGGGALTLLRRSTGLGRLLGGHVPTQGLALVRRWTTQHHLHLLKRASTQAYQIGIPAAFIILWLLLATKHWRLDASHRAARSIRIVADSTFPLYLTHLPIFMLIAAYVPYDRSSSPQKIALLLTAIIFAVTIDIPIARFKNLLRRFFHERSLAARVVDRG